MAGCVDNDVLAALPDEKCPGRVDGNALLLLFQKRIEEKGVFEFLALLATDRLHLLQLSLRERPRIGIEPAKQRRLAVVDVADNDDVQSFIR